MTHEEIERQKPDNDVDNNVTDNIVNITDSKATSGSASPCSSEDEDTDDRIIVTFDENDKTNPFQWSRWKKLYVVIVGIFMVLNSTIGSALPSGATETTQQYFDIRNEELLVLPISIYLIGYVLGPIVFAPLSESYGRKIIMICTFVLFTAFAMASALAPTFASLIVFRLLVGIGASTPVSVIGGIYADLYKTKKARGLAMTAFMAGTTWGPLTGPLISGFVAPAIGWRWIYWIQLMFAGATWPFLLLMPETFGPVILKRKARQLRKEAGSDKYVAPADLEKQDLREILTVVLMRPIRMFLFEAIVLCVCLFLALEYGIFYSKLISVARRSQTNQLVVFFQAFQPIFGGVYGFNPGEVGLCFLPIGIGSWLATAAYLWWDWYLERAQSRASPPAWSKKEEYVRLPMSCFGGPLIVTYILEPSRECSLTCRPGHRPVLAWLDSPFGHPLGGSSPFSAIVRHWLLDDLHVAD